MDDVLLGIDVGATGIKAGAFSTNGKLISVVERRNGPKRDARGQPGWMIWDPDEIWETVCGCVRACLAAVKTPEQVKAVACTGFGADGLPADQSGAPLYPFISWHCGRTAPQQAELNRRVGPEEIFRITGYHNYHINTANRLLWFRQQHPEILERTHRWLQVQDFVAQRLSGAFATDCTIASTTMLLDLGRRRWSAAMLAAAEIDPQILPPIREAGTQIGVVTKRAAELSGLKEGTPVVTGGHDCEIAVLGAGVNDPETWIDITGTWEILIATVDRFDPRPVHFDHGLDFECHALPGQWICQSLMIAGGVVEWVRQNFYRGEEERDVYRIMFGEAETSSHGVYVLPSFMRGMGPDASRLALGTILGLQTTTTRGQIVRATLEGLCFQLRRQVDAIAEAVGHPPKRLRVVGGGQKNPLWLQLKADITGLPVEITTNPEGTLLGVAILAGIGAGLYKSIEDAHQGIGFSVELYEPDPSREMQYTEQFENAYRGLAEANSRSFEYIDRSLR